MTSQASSSATTHKIYLILYSNSEKIINLAIARAFGRHFAGKQYVSGISSLTCHAKLQNRFHVHEPKFREVWRHVSKEAKFLDFNNLSWHETIEEKYGLPICFWV